MVLCATELVVPSGKPAAIGGCRLKIICEVPSIAVVAARGPAVPTPGTAGPPGKPENWFMISELQPFIDTISMLTLRNLPQGQDSLAHIPWKVREHCKLAHMALYPTGHASFSP